MDPGLPDDIFGHLFRFCDILTSAKMTMLCRKMSNGAFVWRQLSTLEVPPPHIHSHFDIKALLRTLHRWRNDMICLASIDWRMEMLPESRKILVDILISVAPQVKLLNLTSKTSDGVSAEQQQQLVSRLDPHRLEELNIPFFLSEDVLELINRGIPKLKQLRIRTEPHAPHLVAQVLSALASKTGNLERLYIHTTADVEQQQCQSLVDLIRANPNLHRIHLFKWNIGHKSQHPFEIFFPRTGAAENFGYGGPFMFSLIEAAGPVFPGVVRVNNESLWEYFMGMNSSLAETFDICQRYFGLCHQGDGPVTRLIDFAAPLPQLSRDADVAAQMPQVLIDWLDDTLNSLIDDLPEEMRGNTHSLAGKAAIRAAVHFAAATFVLPPSPDEYAAIASSKPLMTLKRIFGMLGGQRALMVMLSTTGVGMQPNPMHPHYRIAAILLSDSEWCSSVKLDPAAYDSSGSTLLWYLEPSPDAILAFLKNSGFDPVTTDVDGEVLVTGTLFRTMVNAIKYPAIYAPLFVELLELHSSKGIKVSTLPTISSQFLHLLLNSHQIMTSFARVFPDSANLFLVEPVFALHASSGMLTRLIEFLKIQSIFRGETELPGALVSELESRIWADVLRCRFSSLVLQFSISEILAAFKRVPDPLVRSHLATLSQGERESFLNVLWVCGVHLE